MPQADRQFTPTYHWLRAGGWTTDKKQGIPLLFSHSAAHRAWSLTVLVGKHSHLEVIWFIANWQPGVWLAWLFLSPETLLRDGDIWVTIMHQQKHEHKQHNLLYILEPGVCNLDAKIDIWYKFLLKNNLLFRKVHFLYVFLAIKPFISKWGF